MLADTMHVLWHAQKTYKRQKSLKNLYSKFKEKSAHIWNKKILYSANDFFTQM